MPTELEFRGPLTRAKFYELNRKLRALSRRRKRLDRLTMMYFPPGFARATISKSRMDIRLRINNYKPELVMKIGHQNSPSRSEFTIEIGQASFIDTVEFLSSLGFTRGFLQRQYKDLYDYKGIEIDLGYIEHFGYYFEVEKVVYDKNELEGAKSSINRLCRGLGLRFYGKKEYKEAIARLDSMQESFDLRRISIAEIMKSNPGYFGGINAAYSKLKRKSSYVYRY
jgi:predicted adenylyl cyclase CyaB